MTYQIFLIKLGATESANINYELRNFTDISINKNTPISPMPLPEEDSAENVLIKIEGNTTTISLDWKIVKFADNYGFSTGAIAWYGANARFQATADDGTHNDIFKQMQKLIDFVPKKITDSYKLQIYEQKSDVVVADLDITGLPQGISFRTDSASPIVWGAHMDFTQGAVVSSLSVNVPAQAKISSASFTTTGTPATRTGVSVTFKEFQNYVGSDRPTITGAKLRYKAAGTVANSSFFSEKEKTFSANTLLTDSYTEAFTISDLNAAGKYLVKIALFTAGGTGAFSEEVTVS